MKRLTLLITIILLFSTATYADDQEKKTIENDLLKSIDKIAAQWGVTREEVLHKGLSLLIDSQFILGAKGGVGIVRDHMYVVTRSSKNEIIAGESRTTSAVSDTPEIFTFSQGKFIGSVCLPKGGDEDVVLVLFTPQKIKIFDWKNLSGGYYIRSRE